MSVSARSGASTFHHGSRTTRPRTAIATVCLSGTL